MDPLALLREYCVTKKLDTVVRNGSRIDFGDLYSFESSTLTRFRSRGGYYTLGTIFFFLQHKTEGYGQYFQNAKKENLDTVAMVDKKTLLDYLEGKAETCPQIDTTMPNLPMSAGMKRSNEEFQSHPTRKLQKIENDQGEEEISQNPDEWTIEQIYAQEQTPFHSADGMRVERDFSYVLSFVQRLLTERGPRDKSSLDLNRQPRQFLRPIILVPSGMSVVLNMYNVKEFLENGKYVFPEQIYKASHSKDSRMLIARSFERERPVHYMVSDKLPNQNDTATWKRVVAVVVNGKASQFKMCPFEGCDKGDVYDLLHNRVQGYYFQYHDDNFNESEARSWKVKVLSIHRHHRHGDHLLMQQFWRQFDQFMIEKRLDRLFKY